MNKKRFLGRYGPWAVVTGASEGIGRAFAEQVAACGLNLVLVARRGERLNWLAKHCEAEHHVAARVVAADLSCGQGRAALAQATRDLDLGLLVAAAGFGTSGPLLKADLEVEHQMLELNCFTLLEQCVSFGNRLAGRGGGGIILMASLVGWQGVARSAHYSATKAYVQSLAEALHVELKPLGVDVLSSAPGPVRSGFGARANMLMGTADQPATVAKASLNALGRQATVVPGAFGKLLTYSLLPLPRSARVNILARVMGGMTAHQRESGE